ncbi:unnamed protein product [Acanthosepion pharaonis]|uniref:Uncharacterized protein n=1 Tax=Acanthosepion pharaonis TaxID=158019 RepID=A0A812B414_ACAPH|nr:unnamed protein product [Sepia pharaonis]
MSHLSVTVSVFPHLYFFLYDSLFSTCLSFFLSLSPCFCLSLVFSMRLLLFRMFLLLSDTLFFFLSLSPIFCTAHTFQHISLSSRHSLLLTVLLLSLHDSCSSTCLSFFLSLSPPFCFFLSFFLYDTPFSACLAFLSPSPSSSTNALLPSFRHSLLLSATLFLSLNLSLSVLSA